MSDADTKRAIKAHAFDKIVDLVNNHKYWPTDKVEDVLADARAQLQVIDEQAKQRNR